MGGRGEACSSLNVHSLPALKWNTNQSSLLSLVGFWGKVKHCFPSKIAKPRKLCGENPEDQEKCAHYPGGGHWSHTILEVYRLLSSAICSLQHTREIPQGSLLNLHNLYLTSLGPFPGFLSSLFHKSEILPDKEASIQKQRDKTVWPEGDKIWNLAWLSLHSSP